MMEDSVSDVKTEEATPIEGTGTDTVFDSDMGGEAAAVSVKKPKKPINQQKLQDNIWGWAFCAPLIIGTCVFVFFAFIVAIMMSFTGYRGDGTFSGTLFDYIFGGNMKAAVDDYGNSNPFVWYIKMVMTSNVEGITKTVQGEATWKTLFNAVFYMIGIPVGMILSMVFAVLMSRDIKGGGVFRVLYYVPVISSTVAISYTFHNLFQTQGVINHLFHSSVVWLAPAQMSTNSFANWMLRGLIMKTPILVMCIWKGLGGTIVLFCAGLSGVNAATKEAASIDGANSWQIFWNVTMPDLAPTIFYTIVTSVIGGMQIYAEPQLLFAQSSGIMYEVDGFVAMIWYYGLQINNSFNYAYGCALGMLLFVIILILTLIQFYMDSKKED